VFAARDRYSNDCYLRYHSTDASLFSHNRDVAIKLVQKGDEGRSEYEILHLLNSAPLRNHLDNATITVVEFIECNDWHFAVMPFCDGCDDVPFRNAAEALDFAEQVVSIRNLLTLFHRRSIPLIVIHYYRDYASCTIIISHIWYAPYVRLDLSLPDCSPGHFARKYSNEPSWKNHS
jgi:hypothetical protein